MITIFDALAEYCGMCIDPRHRNCSLIKGCRCCDLTIRDLEADYARPVR